MRCPLLPAAAGLVLLALAAVPGRAQTTTVVAPNAFATTDGDTGSFLPFFAGFVDSGPVQGSPVRYQQVFAASQFSLIPAGGALITQLAFRPDAGSTTAFNVAMTSFQLNLSTTVAAPDALSNTFASNLGADDTVVFPAGPLTLATTNTTDPTTGARVFDLVVTLTTPFRYDPARGNLLLDIRNANGGVLTGVGTGTPGGFNGTLAGPTDDSPNDPSDPVSRVFNFGSATDPTATDADTFGLVTRFTIVPEPSTWALLLAAGAAALLLSRNSPRNTRKSEGIFVLFPSVCSACSAGTLLLFSAAARAQNALPAPAQSGIKHIILVTMENRSFDHLVGWIPGANGSQAGRTYPDKAGLPHPTFAIASGGSPADPRDPNAPAGSEPADFRGCLFADPDHGYPGGRLEYDNGLIDGFLRAGTNDLYPLSYYRQQDLTLYGGLLPAFTTFDNYFCAILGPTYSNRFYFHAASTDRIDNTSNVSTLPTIWDALMKKGVSARYYYNDAPFLPLLFGTRFTPISKLFSQFLLDCQNDTLPAYCQVDPRFLDETSGTSVDDHPHADLRNGQAYLNTIYNAVRSSPAWSSTVMVLVYDDWGGFFDHVVPPVGAIGPAEIAAGYTDGLRGFRVPCVVISPFARAGVVNHELFDHASILKMVEWRFGLKPLAARDAAAANLATALDFAMTPRLTTPAFTVPAGVFPPCTTLPAGGTVTNGEFSTLRQKALDAGYPIE